MQDIPPYILFFEMLHRPIVVTVGLPHQPSVESPGPRSSRATATVRRSPAFFKLKFLLFIFCAPAPPRVDRVSIVDGLCNRSKPDIAAEPHCIGLRLAKLPLSSAIEKSTTSPALYSEVSHRREKIIG